MSIATEQFGPVDLYVLGIPSEAPDSAALEALLDLVGAGVLRLLDLIVVSKTEDGETAIVEIEALPAGFDFDEMVLGAVGLVGEDDITDLAVAIPAGTSALVVAVELVYQRELAARTAESGATLLAYERIPAPVVNALVDSLISNLED